MRHKGDSIGFIDPMKVEWWDGKSEPHSRKEEWTFVKEHSQCYIISTRARIARVCGGHGARVGRLLRHAPEGKAADPARDYLIVQLSVKGEHSMCRINRLVALAFKPTEYDWCDVHHIDHDPQNNNVENVEWQDSLEHRQDASAEADRYGGRRGGIQYGRSD